MLPVPSLFVQWIIFCRWPSKLSIVLLCVVSVNKMTSAIAINKMTRDWLTNLHKVGMLVYGMNLCSWLDCGHVELLLLAKQNRSDITVVWRCMHNATSVSYFMNEDSWNMKDSWKIHICSQLYMCKLLKHCATYGKLYHIWNCSCMLCCLSEGVPCSYSVDFS